MARLIQFVEVNVYEGMAPLVSGYLQCYACLNPKVAAEYEFRQYSTCRKTSRREMLDEILGSGADIYAFSCYVWNIGLISELVRSVVAERPNACIILGGPQVMQHAQQYLDPAHPHMFVCDGEGERTFASLLHELLEEAPDFSQVKGLSFYREGQLVTTEPQERIRDLEEIPSPFLSGVIQPGYRMSVIETNRGCPFRCGFCYWGAANNDQVFKFSEQRIRDEITWLAQNEVPVLHIADANWGMLKRDIDLSLHISDCKAAYYYPFAVIFAAAKNSPARVTEATRIFTRAGLINTQPISMQSLDETTLKLVDRSNIKLAAYADLQSDLNQRGIGSYIELIWPLPGETLDSFKSGVEKLCERGAASIIVYAHLLLHNTPIYRDRDALGLVTRRAYDDAAEAQIITQTRDVDYEDFKSGMRFIYAVNALHNAHLQSALGAYLQRRGILSFAQLLDRFIAFSREQETHPFTAFCQRSIEDALYYEFTNYPALYHLVLHGERESCAGLWHQFCAREPWWADANARVLFEIDLLAKPFLYANTPYEEPAWQLEEVTLLDCDSRSCVISVSATQAALAAEFLPGLGEQGTDFPGARCISIVHPQIRYPYSADRSEEDNADYCSGMITRVAQILPTLSFTEAVDEAARAG